MCPFVLHVPLYSNIQPFRAFHVLLSVPAIVHGHQEAAQKQVDTAEEKQRFAGRRREAMKERARAAKEKKQAQGSLW